MRDEPMPGDRNLDELDEYLRGESALSRRYQREPAPVPPHALDRLVLESARQAPLKSKAPLKSQSLAPLALAASVLLSVALVLAIVFGPQAAKRNDDKPLVLRVRMYKSEPPRAALASARERNPAAWLDDISALRRAGRDSEADAEMRRFRSAYPGYIIPTSE
jgi:negative regulator of sigma E activity